MKRTTYAMIALMAGGFVLMAVLLLAAVALGWDKRTETEIYFTHGQAERALPPCRVLVLEAAGMPDSLANDDEIHFFRQADFRLMLRPASEGEGGKLSLPAGADSCLTVATAGDTLRLTFDPYATRVAETMARCQKVTLVQDDWELRLPRGIECIASRIDAQLLALKELAEDSLCVQTAPNLEVSGCRFGALRLEHVERVAQRESGTCRALDLDVDGVEHWNASESDFRADRFYVTGHKGGIVVDNRNFGQVLWLPKDDDAHLNVELAQPGRIVLDE